jgi:small neutral amino acid transporter SnatA (MarC family)
VRCPDAEPAALTDAHLAMESAMAQGDVLLGFGKVFTLLFVTLGPIKIVGPFLQLTRDADDSTLRQIAVRACVLGVIAVVVGGFVGWALLENWHLSVWAMTLAGGIIFFLVGLSVVFEQYRPEPAAPPPLPAAPMAAALRLAFPTVITPYGIAAVIALLANSPHAARTATIVAMLTGVMALNLLSMLSARLVMGGVAVMVLRIFGAVLAVLQVAVAVEFIFLGLRGIGVV